MDTKGHHAIAVEAGEPKLKAAFNSACQPELRLGAFYFGNWLTDVSQSVDYVAFDAFEHKAGDFINNVCTLAEHVCNEYLRPIEKLFELPVWTNQLSFSPFAHPPQVLPLDAVQIIADGIQAMRNELLTAVRVLFGNKQILEQTFQHTFEICGYFKFVHPVENPDGYGTATGRTIDFHAFMEIFKNRFTCYYPHEHMDRPEILGASTKGKPQYESSPDIVDRLIHGRKLRSRQTRLRDRGYLTLPEAAAALGISTSEVCRRRNEGSVVGLPYGLNKYLYEPTWAGRCNNPAESVAV